MSASWIVPVVVISYIVLIAWYSKYMAERLNTNYVFLVVIGLLFPPIWLVLLIASLLRKNKDKKASPLKVKLVKSPKKVKSKK